VGATDVMSVMLNREAFVMNNIGFRLVHRSMHLRLHIVLSMALTIKLLRTTTSEEKPEMHGKRGVAYYAITIPQSCHSSLSLRASSLPIYWELPLSLKDEGKRG